MPSSLGYSPPPYCSPQVRAAPNSQQGLSPAPQPTPVLGSHHQTRFWGGVSQGVGDDCVAEAECPGTLPAHLPPINVLGFVGFFFFLLPRELQICLRFAVIWPRVLLGRPEQPAAGCGPTAGGRRGGCEGSGCSATTPSAATPGSLGIPSATVPGSSSSPRCRCPQ